MAIDLERILDAAEGDPTFVRELLSLFLKDTAAKMSALLEAVARGEAPTVSAIAHQLKGSSANVGADKLTAHARSLEELARSGQLTGADARLRALSEELDIVRVELEAVLASS